MDSSAAYTDDSVAQFLIGVADKLNTCADHGTQGLWQVSSSPRSFITDHAGGVVCGAVQKSNARLILAACPDGPRATAELLRAVAAQPVTEQTRPMTDAAFSVAAHYNSQMRLKVDSQLRPAQVAAS